MRRSAATSRSAAVGACLCLALAAGGCHSNANPGAPDLAQPFRSAIVFSATEAGLESGALAERVDFSQLRDLWVRVTVPGMPRVGVLTVIFVNPVGNIFFVEGTYFSPEPMMKEIDDPTLGHKLPVIAAKPLKGGFALDHGVAIGGTSFQRYPVPDGTWEIRAMMDGMPGILTTTLQVATGQ